MTESELPFLNGRQLKLIAVPTVGELIKLYVKRATLRIESGHRTLRATCFINRPGLLIRMNRAGLTSIWMHWSILDGSFVEDFVRADSWHIDVVETSLSDRILVRITVTERTS